MNEFISLMLHGIKLAKDLEPTLRNLATQADMLSKLDEIIRVFISARERLDAHQDSGFYHQMVFRDQHQLQQDWVIRDKSMMELFQTQGTLTLETKSSSSGGGGILSGGNLSMELGGSSTDVHTMASTSSQRVPRRRQDDAEKRTMRVPAPSMGNTEIPPEDGYTWRKYGQKEILGSKYPRGYYRCTHQKLYQCPAKKQVQRLDDDPFTFEVTYRGDHTCHMSATAPSIPPPPPQHLEISQEMSTQTMGTVHHPPPWLEFSLGGGGGGAASGGSSSSGAGAGPSTTTVIRSEYPVADLADVMFNSGSSSTNSMELIFTSMEDHKWDQCQEDKKTS